jgi:hypothetical protein
LLVGECGDFFTKAYGCLGFCAFGFRHGCPHVLEGSFAANCSPGGA